MSTADSGFIESEKPFFSAEEAYRQTLNEAWIALNQKQRQRASVNERNRSLPPHKKMTMPEDDMLDPDWIEDYGHMENVRLSNFAYTKTRVAEYMMMYFSLVSLCSSLIAVEID